jgi:glycerophosphoryl diester phosphodiesterase
VTIAIAHRGDPVGFRENTLEACASAVHLGADMVEIDLRRTNDGEIVVLHDQSLLRLWGVDKNVGDLDLPELKSIGSIPTYRQVLEAVAVPLMVDFTRREVVEEALRVTMDAGALDRALFVTGNVEALRLLRTLSGEARIGLTWVKPDPPSPALLGELEAEYWNPMYQLITPSRVADVHDLGLKVSTWTVDARRHMRRMVAAGVDAIVSNRIAVLRRELS